MKHGPNALIDEKLPVVVLATRDPDSDESRVLYEKTLSNIQEVKAREGIVVAIVMRRRRTKSRNIADHVDRHPAAPPSCCCPSWRSCRCSCSRITSPCAAAATSISRATSPRASRSSRLCSQATHQLTVPTRGKGLYDLTREVATWVRQPEAATGLLTVFFQHTSASLVIQENADPDVVARSARFLRAPGARGRAPATATPSKAPTT